MLPLSLSLPVRVLDLSYEVLTADPLAVLNKKIVNQIAVQFLEITDPAELTHLVRVKETKVWLKLRLDQRPVNLLRQNLIGQVESVVRAVVGHEALPRMTVRILHKMQSAAPSLSPLRVREKIFSPYPW